MCYLPQVEPRCGQRIKLDASAVRVETQMAHDQSDWNGLVRSIRSNRAGTATFYKPVCVIAAIDLADIGRLDSALLHSELIIRRFGEYVAVAFPERASAGWQPLWFLANDGLWDFSKEGKLLTREDVRDAPSTKRKAFTRFDTQAISQRYKALWESAAQRKSLREQMLLILSRDVENRTLLRALFNAHTFTDPERWLTDDVLDLHILEIGGQGDLFGKHQRDTSGASSAASTKSVGKALLAFEVDKLPQTSTVGPTFDDTGHAPVRLASAPRPDFPTGRADLHEALAAKCQNLINLAAASNRAAHILPALQSMVSTLETGPSQSSSYLVWSHGNTLRRLHDEDLRVSASDDPEAPPLPHRLRVLLSDIIEQFNVFTLTDPIVGLLDRAKVGPERRLRSLQALEAGVELVEAIQETPEIVEPNASQVLETATIAAQEAKSAPGFNADQAIVNGVEIQRSGARAILSNARRQALNVLAGGRFLGKAAAEGAAKQTGAELVKHLTLASFVVGAGDIFRSLWQGVAGSNQVQQLIGLFRDLIRTLSH